MTLPPSCVMSSCPDGSPILLIGQLHPPTVAIRSRPCWGCRRSHAALGMPRLAGSGKRSVPVGALGRSDQFGGGRGVETERVASKLVQCRLVDSNALQCNVLLVPWRQGLSRTQIRTFEGGEGARQAPRGKKRSGLQSPTGATPSQPDPLLSLPRPHPRPDDRQRRGGRQHAARQP